MSRAICAMPLAITSTTKVAKGANAARRGQRLHWRRDWCQRCQRKSSSTLAPADEVPYESLKARRLEAAREANVPAFVILHDSVLREIAAARPKNKAALAAISGIGESKLLRFGKGILGLSPPSREDLPVRDVSAKSARRQPAAFLRKPCLLWPKPLN